MSSEFKRSVVSGTLWAFLERFSTQFMSIVIGMVLARLLTPTDYGTVALLSIFICVAGVLADSGFGLALIQKKDIDELGFNSVFYASLVVSFTLYVVLFFSATLIADFYNTPILVSILRIQALCLILNSIDSIQNAEISRNLKFNLSFKISVMTAFTQGIVGITLAFLGYGVWALVWSTLCAGVVGTISRWFIVSWRPKLMFSFSALKPLFNFGWRMVLINLIDTIYKNLYGFLIGKFYTKADLAFVNKGQSQPSMIMNSVEGTLARVTLPTFAKVQDDRSRLVSSMRKMIVCSTYVVFPLMTVIGCTAHSQIQLMYGEQWLPAVPYVQVACFMMALYPFHNMNLQAIASIGRTDLNLKIEIIKKIFSVIVIIIAVQVSPFALLASMAFIIGPVSVIINSWPSKRLFGYSLIEQIKDIAPSAIVCVISGILMLCVQMMHLYFVIEFFIQSFVGLFSYVVISCYFRINGAREYANIMGDGFIKKLPGFIRPKVYKFYNYIIS